MNHGGMNHSGMGDVDQYSRMGGMNNGGMGGVDHSGNGGMSRSGTNHVGIDNGGNVGMDHDGTGMKMQMYFHGGYTEYILFEKFRTTTVNGFVFACLGVFLLGFSVELLKLARQDLARAVGDCNAKNKSACSECPSINKPRRNCWREVLAIPHLLQTVLHLLQFLVGYSAMLVFMTFNTWLCLSLSLGSATGYLLLGWRRALPKNLEDAGDCCP